MSSLNWSQWSLSSNFGFRQTFSPLFSFKSKLLYASKLDGLGKLARACPLKSDFIEKVFPIFLRPLRFLWRCISAFGWDKRCVQRLRQDCVVDVKLRALNRNRLLVAGRASINLRNSINFRWLTLADIRSEHEQWSYLTRAQWLLALQYKFIISQSHQLMSSVKFIQLQFNWWPSALGKLLFSMMIFFLARETCRAFQKRIDIAWTQQTWGRAIFLRFTRTTKRSNCMSIIYRAFGRLCRALKLNFHASRDKMLFPQLLFDEHSY